MIIKKNFIKKKEVDKIYEVCLGGKFPWFLSPVSFHTDKERQLVHVFYMKSQLVSPVYIEYFAPIINKLNAKSIWRMKLNCTWKTPKIIEHKFHQDIENKGYTSSIFYLNTNNGYTRFKDKNIKSEENKLVTFPSEVWHSSTTHTDTDFRLVLNIIYEKI
jgi:hypothetical protein